MLPLTDERTVLERPVARLTVTADAGLLPVVVDFVRRVAHRLGLRDRAAERLDWAVETVCRNVIEHAFEAMRKAATSRSSGAPGGSSSP